MNKLKVKIGFIGAGSIGSLFGGYLADIKSDIYSINVIFFCLKAHAYAVNKKGLKLYRDQEIKIIKNIKAYENEKNFEDNQKKDSNLGFDFIFLTTKAYDIESAMVQYKKTIDVSKYLVILQNGIGNEDIVSKYCEKAKIIRVVTTNGALLDKPGHLIHTGKGITKIGFPYPYVLNVDKSKMERAESDLIKLKDILNSSGLETIVVKDIIKESWEKVFVNIGINAVGALTRLPNGKLLEIEGIKSIMREAIKEATEVAKMKNIKLPEKDYISITFDVAKKTAENKNSMLQDILNRQLTEIDFINGRILKYATELGVKVPVNEILTHLIKGLEYSRI
ncbi:MAG: ketopantoate reductase family protein [Candidatus Hodarchaeota archaeon]